VSRKKQQQQVEEEAVDKMDLFLAEHYKKLLAGVAVLLILFLAGYAFKTMQASKNDLLASKAGQLEMIVTMSGGKNQLDNYLAMTTEYPAVGDYVNLKAGEVLLVNGDKDGAAPLLATAGGDYKELADGLAFDAGVGNINPETYLTAGKMGALWYYRAYLASEGDKQKEILETFKVKYPNNELLQQIERWDG